MLGEFGVDRLDRARQALDRRRQNRSGAAVPGSTQVSDDWPSTTCLDLPLTGWRVDFSSAETYTPDKATNRCVRGVHAGSRSDDRMNGRDGNFRQHPDLTHGRSTPQADFDGVRSLKFAPAVPRTEKNQLPTVWIAAKLTGKFVNKLSAGMSVHSRGGRPAARFVGRLAAALLALLAAGCSTLLAVREQQEKLDARAVIGGKVRVEGRAARGPLVVGLAARGPSGFRLVDHFVSEKGGSWVIAAEPGTYWAFAFEDADGDGRYDDEPVFRPGEADGIKLGPGQHRLDLDLVIRDDVRFVNRPFSVEEVQLRGQEQQQTYSLYAMSVAGEQVTLDDPRFSAEVASSGMWKPYDFLLQAQPGIYFLEPYDPGRIPVLFVHGIGGSPTDFRELIASLDHSRFQAWVAYYPTGGRLDGLSRWLAQVFVRLRTRYRFGRSAVVAHSMGGLVARGFVLEDFDATGTESVRTFVTISSPLGGMPSAAKGVEQSPVVLRSWLGLAPGSDFLDGLFYSDLPARKQPRRLPPHMRYDLVFGYRGGGLSGSSDGVVALSSQLRIEAQKEAETVRGFDETHTGILRSPAVAEHLRGILDAIR